jgi:hypothetical protein
VEGLLGILQDLVALTLASIGIGAGVMTAFGNVQSLRQPALRMLASVIFLCAGLWVFYIGIRHLVAG